MFGDRLKKIRKEKNITQEELADIINVAPSTIGMYEQSRREPEYEILKKISDFFNVTIDYLLGKSDIQKKEIDFSKDKVAFACFGGVDPSKLTEEAQERIKRIIQMEIELAEKENKDKK